MKFEFIIEGTVNGRKVRESYVGEYRANALALAEIEGMRKPRIVEQTPINPHPRPHTKNKEQP